MYTFQSRKTIFKHSKSNTRLGGGGPVGASGGGGDVLGPCPGPGVRQQWPYYATSAPPLRRLQERE